MAMKSKTGDDVYDDPGMSTSGGGGTQRGVMLRIMIENEKPPNKWQTWLWITDLGYWQGALPGCVRQQIKSVVVLTLGFDQIFWVESNILLQCFFLSCPDPESFFNVFCLFFFKFHKITLD